MEFLIELLFYLGLEGGADVLMRLAGSTFEAMSGKKRSPWLAAFGYVLLGAIVGGLSLLLFPSAFLPQGGLRVLHVIVAPLVAGGMMALLGKRRRRSGKSTIRLETFGCGYAFALALALVRYAFAS